MLQALLDRADPAAGDPRIDRLVFAAGLLALALGVTASMLPGPRDTLFAASPAAQVQDV